MKTLALTIPLALITQLLYSPAAHAKRYTLDQIAIDTTTGIAKGLDTDLGVGLALPLISVAYGGKKWLNMTK